MAEEEDKKPSQLDKLKKVLLDPGREEFLDAGELDISVSVIDMPFDIQQLLEWWLRNREYLVPYLIPKQMAAFVDVTGGVLDADQHYNNTALTFVFSRTSAGQYKIAITAGAVSEFPKFSFQLVAVGTAGETMTVASAGPEEILIKRFDSAANYEDGDWYIELGYWD
jgi:hypothetical protein